MFGWRCYDIFVLKLLWSSFDKSCNSVLYVTDFIRDLIEKKQLIEAVRLICPFKLIDKFPPVPLLEEFVENAKLLCTQMSKRHKLFYEKVPLCFLSTSDIFNVNIHLLTR